MANHVSRQEKRKTTQFRVISTCVDHLHYILLLKYLSNHMHFITNGYKCFEKTNSTDPRQCVLLRSNKLNLRTHFVAVKLTG